MKKNKARMGDNAGGGAQGKDTILNGVVKESITHWRRDLKEVREPAMQISDRTLSCPAAIISFSKLGTPISG